MQGVFLEIVSIGMNASWMILVILLLRVLFWKSPKWIMCFLWILVDIRLICPYEIESTMSLVPVRIEVLFNDSEKNMVKNEKEKTYIHIDRNPFANSRIKSVRYISQPGDTKIQEDSISDRNERRIVPDSTVMGVFVVIWLCGMFAMFSYFILSCIYIHKKTKTATHFTGNIWESEFVASPYIFGLICPKIYIPYGMNEESLVYILAHERAHLKRKDHILKIVAFLILSVYWFHPLVWVAYVFFGRDIELACDEKAVSNMDKQERKNYLLALLKCSTSRKSASVYPLAFGKIALKERVIRMKQWKKPSFILITAMLFVCIIVTVCFFTNPKTQGTDEVTAQTNANPVAMDVKHASVNLSENTGADGTMIYYVDAKKIIFGGCFGLFVYDKVAGRIVQSLDLEYIGCNRTQGDNYCEIATDKVGQRVYLNPVRQKKLYIFELLSGKLEIKDYPKSDIWKDSSLKLFHVENTKQVSYHDGKEERICILNENDFTIGNCTYADYRESGSTEEIDYYPLFSDVNQ